MNLIQRERVISRYLHLDGQSQGMKKGHRFLVSFFPLNLTKKVMAKKVRSSTAVWTFLFSTPSGPGQVMSTITFQFFAIFYPRAVAASAVAIRYRSARPDRRGTRSVCHFKATSAEAVDAEKCTLLNLMLLVWVGTG